MTFDGTRFFEAVKGWPHDIGFKYLIYLWQYWKATHCTGLINDDEILRRMGECEIGGWQRIKSLIFDGEHFFYLENGKWHQKRCREFYQKSMITYQKNLAKTEAARNQSLVIKTVTSSVTDENWLKSLSTNAAFNGIDIQRELGKLTAWCSVNSKQVTRKRFINWLNQAEKPLTNGFKREPLKFTPPPALKGKEQGEAILKSFGEQIAQHRKTI